MANVKNFGLIGVGSNVQFGKAGSKIVLDSGTFKLRDSANAADVALTAADITSSGNVAISGTSGTFSMNGDTTISRHAAGVAKFEGSAAFMAPVGNNAARPSSAATGMIRMNSQNATPVVEYYNGTEWKTVATGGEAVTSVTGTADRIAVDNTDPTDPIIDIASTYAGQASINTVGTISTGTWHGTVISPTYGGTGVNNGSRTITLGGNLSTDGALTFSGAFPATVTVTGSTNVTLPLAGTLATTAQIDTLNDEVNGIETALGSGYNSTTNLFDPNQFTNSAAGSTSFTDAINQVAAAVAAGNTLDEIFPATAAGNVIFSTGSGTYTWQQGSTGQSSGVQGWDAGLASIAGLTTSADQMIYTTGSDTYATTGLTSFARTLLDDADATTARSTLGVVIGTDVQAHDAGLDALAAKTSTGIMVQTGDNTYSSVSIAGTSGNIVVTNGSGTGGNPTINLAEVTQDEGTSGKTFSKIALDSFGRVIGNTPVTTADITALVNDTYVNVSGDTMTGDLSFGGTHKVTGLANPTQNGDAANKSYVDTAITNASNNLQTEVDAIETAVGLEDDGTLSNTVFTTANSTVFTSAPADVVSAVIAVADYATAHDQLSELNDVVIDGVADNDLLQYNSTAGKWENKAIGSASGVQAHDAGLDALAAKTSTGIMVQTGANSYASREIVAPVAGITITDGDGVSGNPTLALANDLAALEGLTTTGYIVRTGDGTATTRSMVAVTGDLVISGDASGVTTDTTFGLATVTQADSGSFVKISLDSKGRVTGNTAVVQSDITSLVDSVYVNVAGDSMTGNLDFGGTHKVTGLAAPTLATDAANKAYVDNAITGLSWKQSVYALADSNVALSGSGSLVIDGHTMANTERLLLTNQTDPYEDGIYVFSSSGGNWTLARSADADAFAELNGAAVFVKQGNTYADTGWVQTALLTSLTTGPTQTWFQFSGAGAYSAGDGLTLGGTTFSAKIAAGLEFDNNGAIAVNTKTGNAVQIVAAAGTDGEVALVLHEATAGDSGLEQSADGLRIKNGAVTNDMLTFSGFSINADSGIPDSVALGESFQIVGTSTQGISTSVTSGTPGSVTITAANASSSQKGVASFNTVEFVVTNGNVALGTVANSNLANSTITFTGTTGSDAVALGESVAIIGDGGAITTAMSANSLAVSVATASTTVKGVASFSDASFDVSAGGVVTIKAGGVSNSQLANNSVTIGDVTIALGGTETDLTGLTSLEVDNVSINGSTISAIATDSDLVLLPNGAGSVVVGQVGEGLVESDAATALTVRGNTTLTLEAGTGDVIAKLSGTTANKVTVSGPTAAQYATDLGDSDLTNKKYVDDAIASGAAAGAVKAFQAVVSLNGSSAVALGTMPAGATVLSVKVNVTSAANAGTLVVGKSGSTSAYMTADENDTSATGLYMAETFVTEAGSVEILATPAGGSSGSATVIVTYQVAQ